MTEVAPLPSSASPHLQASAASCASDFRTPTPVSPRTVRFYCADVPDLSEFFYSKSMSDVNIVIGDRKIAAHRSRLASVSPFLASIFASDTCEVSTVLIPEVSFAAVNVLINFLYSGFMRVTKKEIASILEVATILGISYPIDIEETELGVVRIKPQSAKKRSLGQEYGTGLMAKKARNCGPKVVIFEGLAKTRVDKLMENLETPAASPRREAETVTLMDVEELTMVSNSLVSDHSFEIVDIRGNSRTVSPNTSLMANPRQIMDITSNPTNREQLIHLESFETTDGTADPVEKQLLADEQNDEPEANLNDSDGLMQPVVLSVQGNIEMHDETVILNELAPTDSHILPSDDEEIFEDVHDIVDIEEDEPEEQRELNEDDATNKDEELRAANEESQAVEQESEITELENETVEQESESAEQESESTERVYESAEEHEETQTNDEEVLAEQVDGSAGVVEDEDADVSKENEQQDLTEEEEQQDQTEEDEQEDQTEEDEQQDQTEEDEQLDQTEEDELQDQTEEDGSSHAEKEAEKNDKDKESPVGGVDLNETIFFSPNSDKSDAEAIEATDDTDSFKSTENDPSERV